MALPTAQQNVWDLVNTSLAKRHDDINEPVKNTTAKVNEEERALESVEWVTGPWEPKTPDKLLEGLGNYVENNTRLEQPFHKPKTGRLTR